MAPGQVNTMSWSYNLYFKRELMTSFLSLGSNCVPKLIENTCLLTSYKKNCDADKDISQDGALKHFAWNERKGHHHSLL